MIPMDELEGRMAAGALRTVMQSAADGGMNTKRIWGGGSFLPDEWYDAADELGVLVYYSPKQSSLQERELHHQIRRLASHPFIVI